MKACRFLCVLLLVTTGAFGDERALRLHSAGSLRAVITEMTQAFTAWGGPRFESTFGAQLDAIRCQVFFLRRSFECVRKDLCLEVDRTVRNPCTTVNVPEEDLSHAFR